MNRQHIEKIKGALNAVLGYEETEEAKLNLLTEIGLTSGSELVFTATEEIRECLSRVTNGGEEVEGSQEHVLSGEGAIGEAGGDRGPEEPSEVHV